MACSTGDCATALPITLMPATDIPMPSPTPVTSFMMLLGMTASNIAWLQDMEAASRRM
jgi:hypothetical protein